MTYNPNYNTGYNQYDPYGYNPYMMQQQQRLQALERHYPQYGQVMNNPQQMQQGQPQQMIQPQNKQNIPALMAVTTEEEARAYQTDLSGATQLFINKEHKEIYAKQFNTQTALVDFKVYTEKSDNINTNTDIISSKKAEEQTGIFTLIQGTIMNFESKLDNIGRDITSLKEAYNNEYKSSGNSKFNGKSESTDAGDFKSSQVDV